jgi:hypothetical protein
MKKLKKLIRLIRWVAHIVAHILRLNHGELITWWKDNENTILMVGFKCGVCGRVSGKHVGFTLKGESKYTSL